MFKHLLAIGAMAAVLAGPTASSAAYDPGFFSFEAEGSGTGPSGESGGITFSRTGSTGTLAFSSAGFTILGSQGNQLAPGTTGSFSGTVGLQLADVSFGGTPALLIGEIIEPVMLSLGGGLTASVDFDYLVVLRSTSFGSLLVGSSPNVSSVSYSGSDPGLMRIRDALPDSSTPRLEMSIQFTGIPRTGTGDFTASGSIANLQYRSAAAIPEPSTMALLAVGVGMIGFSVARTRRRG